MCWAIEHCESSASSAVDNTIYALLLDDRDPSTQAIMLKRFAILSEPQIRAVCGFLNFASVNDQQMDARAAKQALAAYWSRFQ
jgi:hypothetical protein